MKSVCLIYLTFLSIPNVRSHDQLFSKSFRSINPSLEFMMLNFGLKSLLES